VRRSGAAEQALDGGHHRIATHDGRCGSDGSDEVGMSQDRRADTGLGRLPAEVVDWLTKPFASFLRIEAAGGAILLALTIAALAISNSPWSQQFLTFWELPVGIQIGSLQAARSLRDWVNDGLMTLFFFVVALELKRELVLGELRNPRMAALSTAAAAGGMLVPAVLYLVLQWDQDSVHGWGVVMATDTAFVIGCLAILGRRIPQSLRVFMLSLAIIDDIGAILVVAIGYGNQLDWAALAVGGLGIAIIRGMGLLGIRSIPIYFLVGGLIWMAVDASGIHPTVTGVILGLLTPTRRWVSDERLRAILDRVVAYPAGDHWSGDTEDRKALRLAEIAARETLSPVERLEIMLHPWVGFVIMPLFAFANAGVPISVTSLQDPIATAVFFGLALGKPLGVVTFSWLAVRSAIAVRPPNLNWGMLAGGGMLAGIGFTMALFIAGLAFGDDHLNAAKLGILSASVVSAVMGTALLLWLTSSRRVTIG
jgi:Na+:H+ antiporter, NhaA family